MTDRESAVRAEPSEQRDVGAGAESRAVGWWSGSALGGLGLVVAAVCIQAPSGLWKLPPAAHWAAFFLVLGAVGLMLAVPAALHGWLLELLVRAARARKSGSLLLLASGAFMAGRLLGVGLEGDASANGPMIQVARGDGQVVEAQWVRAEELPDSSPDVAGAFVRILDNSIFVNETEGGFVIAKGDDGSFHTANATGKRGKIMFPDNSPASPVHRGHIQGTGNTAGKCLMQGRPRPGIQYAVSIVTTHRGTTDIKRVLRNVCRMNGNIPRQVMVQSTDKGLRGKTRARPEADNLTPGMDTGISPASHSNPN